MASKTVTTYSCDVCGEELTVDQVHELSITRGAAMWTSLYGASVRFELHFECITPDALQKLIQKNGRGCGVKHTSRRMEEAIQRLKDAVRKNTCAFGGCKDRRSCDDCAPTIDAESEILELHSEALSTMVRLFDFKMWAEEQLQADLEAFEKITGLLSESTKNSPKPLDTAKGNK